MRFRRVSTCSARPPKAFTPRSTTCAARPASSRCYRTLESAGVTDGDIRIEVFLGYGALA